MHIIYQPDQEKETNYARESQGRRLSITYKTSLFVIVLVFVILAIWLISMFTPNRIGAEVNTPQQQDIFITASEDPDSSVHIVLPGETLWTLADRYGDHKQDKRAWIEHVKAVNDLQDSTLFIGDTLQIPAGVVK